MKKLNLLFIILVVCSCADRKTVDDNTIINFNHLRHLTESVVLNDTPCDIIHIYAEAPNYQWVDANDEGIACVDDVARAAVLYLRYYELTHADSALIRAKKLLNFVLFMQADDGEFYNFIDANHQINRTGVTSRKSFKHWAARGYWALGVGYRMFKPVDPQFASTLKTAFLKCKAPIDTLLENYQDYTEYKGRKYPQWLVMNSASDATATLLLGLIEYLKLEHDPQITAYAEKLAEGIMEMQVNDESNFNGAFLSWLDVWHAWGNAQTQALASLGQLLDKPNLIAAAQKEADYYYNYLIANGMLNEWSFSDRNNIKQFPQIAYGIRCMNVGLLRLAEATGDDHYAKNAGQCAAWLFGRNAARATMYDAHTGRCYDGISDSSTINHNSGAESTIEALMTLVELSSNAVARESLKNISSDF
ncbi:hypothetical protein JW960_08155 [candidate division KSB1 bacterium]|nr:hypothetical protein [candidate division KSB1 bacterium]